MVRFLISNHADVDVYYHQDNPDDVLFIGSLPLLSLASVSRQGLPKAKYYKSLMCQRMLLQAGADPTETGDYSVLGSAFTAACQDCDLVRAITPTSMPLPSSQHH